MCLVTWVVSILDILPLTVPLFYGQIVSLSAKRQSQWLMIYATKPEGLDDEIVKTTASELGSGKKECFAVWSHVNMSVQIAGKYEILKNLNFSIFCIVLVFAAKSVMFGPICLEVD